MAVVPSPWQSASCCHSRDYRLESCKPGCVRRCIRAMDLGLALHTWQQAIFLDEPPRSRDVEICALEYQNLLLQRAAAQQARESKHEVGAAVLCGMFGRLHHLKLAMAWRMWLLAPPPDTIPAHLQLSAETSAYLRTTTGPATASGSGAGSNSLLNVSAGIGWSCRAPLGIGRL